MKLSEIQLKPKTMNYLLIGVIAVVAISTAVMVYMATTHSAFIPSAGVLAALTKQQEIEALAKPSEEPKEEEIDKEDPLVTAPIKDKDSVPAVTPEQPVKKPDKVEPKPDKEKPVVKDEDKEDEDKLKVRVRRLEMIKYPKLRYTEGDLFDPTGMEVDVHLSNGEVIHETNITFPHMVLGTNTRFIRYKYEYKDIFTDELIDKRYLDFRIKVITREQSKKEAEEAGKNPDNGKTEGSTDSDKNKPVLPENTKPSKLIILEAPKKTDYIEGEPIEMDGLLLEAEYSDKSKQPITNFTYKPREAILNHTFVVVNHKDISGEVKVASPITVRKKSPVKLEIVKNANQTNYLDDEVFNPAQLAVKVTYDNKQTIEVEIAPDDKKELVGGWTFDKTPIRYKQKSVKISYTENGATVSVEQPITTDSKYFIFDDETGTMLSFKKDLAGAPTEIEIPEVYAGVAVTKIANSMLSGCDKVTKVTLPSTLKEIEGFAFYKCVLLKSIEVPASVKSIGRNAFGGCTELAEIKMNATTMIGAPWGAPKGQSIVKWKK